MKTSSTLLSFLLATFSLSTFGFSNGFGKDLVKLPYSVSEKVAQTNTSRQCALVAQNYITSMKKIQKKKVLKDTSFPFLSSSNENGSFVITGKVDKKENKPMVIVSETDLISGETNTMSFPLPTKPTIVKIAGVTEKSSPIIVYSSPSCGTFISTNLNGQNPCGNFDNPKRVSVNAGYGKIDFRNEVLLSSIGRLANFHKKHDMGNELEKSGTNLSEGFVRSCIANSNQISEAKTKTFKTFFPDSQLEGDDGQSTGTFGGGRSARVAQK